MSPRFVTRALTLVVFAVAACRASSMAPRLVPSRPTHTAASAKFASSTRKLGTATSDAPAAGSTTILAAASARTDFPTHTTVQEPHLGKELDPTAALPPYFTSTPALQREHETARQLVHTVKLAVGSGRWHLEIRTGCPVESGGNVIVEARAVVRDASGKVRAYSETVGTGDSAGTWKLYYDESLHLRLIVFAWANYVGQATEGIVSFDAKGRFGDCSYPPGRDPPWACDSSSLGEQGLDPEVTAAIRPEMLPKPDPSGPIVWAASLDPMTEWAKCRTPYQPHGSSTPDAAHD